MKLLDWMKSKNLDDDQVAELLGTGVTKYAVKKWKYGETKPRLPEILRLEQISEGAVTPHDFLSSEEAA